MSDQASAIYDPFDGDLSEQKALLLLGEACVGADDGELFFERTAREALVLDDGRLKSATVDASQGFGLRVVCDEAVGYAHSPEISPASVKRAGAAARLSARDGGGTMSAAPRRANATYYEDANPLDEIAFVQKVEAMRALDLWARSKDMRVKQLSISVSGGRQEIVVLRANGARYADARPMTRVNVSVILEEGDRRETGSAGGGGRRGFGDALSEKSLQALAMEAIRIAQVNLEAQEAPAGAMEVALGPGWCGVLLHEAVGHGLEGDFNRKRTAAFAGLMGQMVAAKGVTVIDDGAIPAERGSLSIDDEAEAGARTVLIEDGKLVAYMHDRQSARLMKAHVTGNGRRESYQYPPMPRMTNTFMTGGDADPNEIIAAVKDGIFAAHFGGGQVDITSGKFVFDCTEAYRVKNGKILHPVKGATLIGDGPTALRKLRMIGNDSKLDPGVGMCGKAGQWVPVTVGQPTVLIDDLIVGGRG